MKGIIDSFESFIDHFALWLQHVLRWSFRHKAVTILVAGMLFAGSVSLIPFGFIGTEFIDMGDRGEIIIQLELPKNAPFRQTIAAVKRVEQLLRSKSEVLSYSSKIGGTSDMVDITSTTNKAEITIKLVPKEMRKYAASLYAQLIKNDLASKVPGVRFVTSVVSPVGGADGIPIQVAVKCSNPDSLYKYAGIVLTEIKKVPGTTDVKISVGEPNPELLVRIDKQKMADLGLTMDNVGATMQVAYNGNTDARFRGEEYEYNINIKIDEFNARNRNDVAELSFINNAGQLIRLDQFSEILDNVAPSRIERYNRMRSNTVFSQVYGRALGDVGNDIKVRLEKVAFPKGVSISYEGDLKAQSDSFGSLGFALLASIVFVYLLMVVLYQSYLYPFVVLFTIPLAIIGALLALAITGQTLSILTIMGLIMLIGLVSKNAILIVDFTNQLKLEGIPTIEALLQATAVRLRPILMTTFSMIIAMLPIALATGSGSVWKNGLAWVLIGGLSSSLFLSLIIIPVVYYLAEQLKDKVKSLVKKPSTETTGQITII